METARPAISSGKRPRSAIPLDPAIRVADPSADKHRPPSPPQTVVTVDDILEAASRGSTDNSFPQFDDFYAYETYEQPRSKTDLQDLLSAEATRLLAVTADPEAPILCPDLGETGDSYRALSGLSKPPLAAVSICQLDNECINEAHCPLLFNRDRLAKLCSQLNIADTSITWRVGPYSTTNTPTLKLMDCVTAALAILITRTARGVYWQANLLAVLVKLTIKLKVVLSDLTDSIGVATKEATRTLIGVPKSPQGSESATDVLDENDFQELFRFVDKRAHEGLIGTKEAARLRYCGDQTKFRVGILTAARHILLSLRCPESQSPMRGHEVCAVVYETSIRGYTTLLF
jgi:hypothetical protein